MLVMDEEYACGEGIHVSVGFVNVFCWKCVRLVSIIRLPQLYTIEIHGFLKLSLIYVIHILGCVVVILVEW